MKYKLLMAFTLLTLVFLSGCNNCNKICGENELITNLDDGYCLCYNKELNITYKINRYVEVNSLEEPYYVCSKEEEKLHYDSIKEREEDYISLSRDESRHFVFAGAKGVNEDIYVGGDVCFLEESFEACEKRVKYCAKELVISAFKDDLSLLDLNYTYVEYIIWDYDFLEEYLNTSDGDSIKEKKNKEIIDKIEKGGI